MLGIVVRLPLLSRPAAVPVTAKPVIKGTNPESRLRLASWMAGRLAAALHALPPERTGRPGRPRVKGGRLPSPAKLAAAAQFSRVTVTRYGKTETTGAAVLTCLRYSVFTSRPVTAVLVRDKPGNGSGIALVTTDTAATAEQIIERYSSRWSIGIAIEDSRQVFGTRQARNRTAAAAGRTVPFQLDCQAVAVTWHDPAGHAPWYTSKAEPATTGMAARLRRVIIAARFKASRPDQPAPAELSILPLAWEDAMSPAA